MELTAISDIFDTRLSTFDTGISVDEYEKSLYLTSAQKKFFIGMYEQFEKDGFLAKALDPFIKETTISSALSRTGVIANSFFFQLPSDVQSIIYEGAVLASSDVLLDGVETKVISTKLAEVKRKLSNPFRIPNRDEVLRVLTYNESTDSVAELIAPTNATISSYKLKYIEYVQPIILETLPDGLSIEGLSAATNSKLHEEQLDKVIDLAVVLVLQDKSIVKSEV